MILGFLGKGGSGKSSVSSQTALYLNRQKTILAIDADHNMDLSFNVTGGEQPDMNFLGDSLADFQKTVGLTMDQKYTKAFTTLTPYRFTLDPISPDIARYSQELENGIRLMVAGPQTDLVLYGKACSHVLTTPLKILLPLLVLEKNEVVIVDEKAGLDGVSTGIITGIDVGVIVCEPALHSIKTAKEIAKLMDFYETPYLFVANKITSEEDRNFIMDNLPEEPVAFLGAELSIKQNPSASVDSWKESLASIFEKSQALNNNNRLERTIKKFTRNDIYQNQ